MLLPSYSIRTVLYLALLVAIVALVGGQAVQGAGWAQAVIVAIGSMVVCWVVYALFYGMVALFARVARVRQSHGPRPAYYPAPKAASATTDGSPATTEDR